MFMTTGLEEKQIGLSARVPKLEFSSLLGRREFQNKLVRDMDFNIL